MIRKMIVVVGPNASGKSALGITIAKKFNGEIISADSRQVYRGLDIGSGKVTRTQRRAIPHHLLDVADPRRTFSVVQYQRLARTAIADIERRGKLPIIVGGTGLYVDAIVDGTVFQNVKPNPALRRRLARWSTERLFRELKRLDPRRAATIDRHNPRRLIRAIEIAQRLGRVPKLQHAPARRSELLLLGLNLPDAALRRNIAKRLAARLQSGLIAEVRRLRRGSVSGRRLNELGLEYRFVNDFLEGRLARQEMERQLERAIWQYARRQRTWFKRDRRIHWVGSTAHAIRLVRQFLQTKKRPHGEEASRTIERSETVFGLVLNQNGSSVSRNSSKIRSIWRG